VSSDQATPEGIAPAPESAAAADDQASADQAATLRRRNIRRLVALGVAVVIINFIAVIFVPPFPRGGQPGDECAFPVCYINGTLEFPPPHVIIGDPQPAGSVVVGFQPSITSTILTMWIVMAVLFVIAYWATRRMDAVPRGLQNLAEFAYESLENFGLGLGGAAAKPYIPLFAAFFVLILFCNWIGLVPPVGKIHELRAPTSDVNITIGLALVSFLFFEYQGFKHLGGGYLRKFFPFYEFKNGIGAGLIALFVGLIELMLEFVKPLTLSMRLFGNIYGGEVALAAITALTLVVLPVLMIGLEVILNFVQALIFSVLTLMFTLLAIEHHDEEGELGEEGAETVEGTVHAGQSPAAAH
jgi:F-type H+-transporting ATPase subunit a